MAVAQVISAKGTGHQECGPLIIAATLGHSHVIDVLLAHSWPVDCAAADGLTPLMAAADAARLDIMEQLLAAGASINQQDTRGWSALFYAARSSGRDKAVPFLINRNADVLLRDSGRMLAEDLAKVRRCAFRYAHNRNIEISVRVPWPSGASRALRARRRAAFESERRASVRRDL
jgi:ankyrin repeat protein